MYYFEWLSKDIKAFVYSEDIESFVKLFSVGNVRYEFIHHFSFVTELKIDCSKINFEEYSVTSE